MLAYDQETLNYQYHLQSQEDLHALLIDAIYQDNIKAVNNKFELEEFVKPIDKYEALHKNFIWYGNKSASQFCIIDIDYEDMPINQYLNHVKKTIGFYPTWITRTNKGYQVGFILDKPVFYSDTLNNTKLHDLKVTLSLLLKADENGSLRNYGYWRNPLTHNSIINAKSFNLDVLLKKANELYFNRQTTFNINSVIDLPKALKSSHYLQDQKETLKSWEHIDKKGFKEGNRNNFLFITAVKLLYAGKIKNNQVLDTLIKINENQLSINELRRITKSVCSYNITPNTEKDKVDMISKRGLYSDNLFKYAIHNYSKDGKMVFERQRFGAWVTVVKKKVKAIKSLENGIYIAYKERKPLTNSNISKYSNKSIRTVQRYKDHKKNIIALAFMRYIKELGKIDKDNANTKKNVIANDTPIKKIINEAIESIYFFTSRGYKVFQFVVDDDLELKFYRVNDC